MKEWQRWENMAREFGSVGDHRREAESLQMALDLLPPGHGDDRVRLSDLLEDARARATERGGEASDEEAGEELLEAREALEPEDAREAVMEEMRRRCTSLEGVDEGDLVRSVAEDAGLERDLVVEAVEDLIDEGAVYRGRPGRLMLDGMVTEEDVETAVLSVLAELATGGRGGSRQEVVRRLTSRGFSRDEVEEAIDELEERGRLEEGHPGQLRPSLAIDEIDEVHRLLMAALEELDPEGAGVLDAKVERQLTRRGIDLEEAREALEELVDSGDVMRDGAEVRPASSAMDERSAREAVMSAVRELTDEGSRPVPMFRIMRRAREGGLRTTMVHRILDSLVDAGRLWRDGRGLHLQPPSGGEAEPPRMALMEVIRELDAHHNGAPKLEVIEMARRKGLEEAEARETLEALIDEGLVHDAGGGFLRPG